MSVLGSLVSFLITFSLTTPAFAQGAPIQVDMVLVLAVDVSDSVDDAEYILQKRGIVEALLNKEFKNTLEQCNDSGIAVTYLEWSGDNSNSGQSAQLVGWTLLKNGNDLRRFSDQVMAAQRLTNAATDIEISLLSSEALIEENAPYASASKVILVSGDGVQNVSPRNSLITTLPNEEAQIRRDEALRYTSRRLVEKGYQISGLAISSASSPIDLEEYFSQNVVGGVGASVRPINGYSEYSKGLLEILLRIANQCIS